MGINAVWGPPQSGKTTMAIDLAFALSRGGQSVLLISPELSPVCKEFENMKSAQRILATKNIIGRVCFFTSILQL